jgi:hypothetical protein
MSADFVMENGWGLAKMVPAMPDDVSKAGSGVNSGEGLSPVGKPPGFWNGLTPWTVLGLLLTGVWVGVLVGIERTEAVPELDKLPLEAGALVVYVIIMASGARVAYKRCQRG